MTSEEVHALIHTIIIETRVQNTSQAVRDAAVAKLTTFLTAPTQPDYKDFRTPHKIALIKAIREASNLGLHESVSLINKWEDKVRAGQ